MPCPHSAAPKAPLNPSLFPYHTPKASTTLVSCYESTPNRPTGSLGDKGATEVWRSSRVVVPKVSGASNVVHQIDTSSALQYGTARGYPPLGVFLRRFARDHLHPHAPYAAGPEIILTYSNTDG